MTKGHQGRNENGSDSGAIFIPGQSSRSFSIAGIYSPCDLRAQQSCRGAGIYDIHLDWANNVKNRNFDFACNAFIEECQARFIEMAS